MDTCVTAVRHICVSGISLQGLTKAERKALLLGNQVAAARHFTNRVKALFKIILGQDGPLGNVVDYFYRLEYQVGVACCKI